MNIPRVYFIRLLAAPHKARMREQFPVFCCFVHRWCRTTVQSGSNELYWWTGPRRKVGISGGPNAIFAKSFGQ